MRDDTTQHSPEHHAKTRLRGSRPLPPRLLYIGTLHTVRAALTGATVVLLPALPLYSQTLRHSRQHALEG